MKITEEAAQRWPFLNDIPLPEGMYWKVYADEPCIGHVRDLWFAWVTMDNWENEHLIHIPGNEFCIEGGASLEDCCRALSNALLVLGVEP